MPVFEHHLMTVNTVKQDEVVKFYEELGLAGQDGWEAVGFTSYAVTGWSGNNNIHFSVLLKRRVG